MSKQVRPWFETSKNVLHRKSMKVPISDKKFVSRIEKKLLDKFNGIKGCAQGISAVQIGEPYRIALIRYKKGHKPFFIINPEILFTFGERLSNEGCLSEPDKRYNVMRPTVMGIKYYSNGKWKRRVLMYKKARIIAHEIDHMNGVLLQDKGRK